VQLKELQHELSCTAALLKVKDSEIEVRAWLDSACLYYRCHGFRLMYYLQRYNKTANQRRKEVTSQVGSKFISNSPC